jgi:hypothetical protein
LGCSANEPHAIRAQLGGKDYLAEVREEAATGAVRMAFRIDYYKEGGWAGSTPHPGPQHETEKFAKDGLIRHRADFYRIIDVGGSNAEVASGRRDG